MSSSSGEEYEAASVNDAAVKERTEKRLGHKIWDIKFGNKLKIAFSVMAILLFPMQMFMSASLDFYENAYILKVQKEYNYWSRSNGETTNMFFTLIFYIARPLYYYASTDF